MSQQYLWPRACVYIHVFICHIYIYMYDTTPMCNSHVPFTYKRVYLFVCAIYICIHILPYQSVCNIRISLQYACIHTFLCVIPRTEEIGLEIITTAKISNKFSLNSPYISNTLYQKSPKFQTDFLRE